MAQTMGDPTKTITLTNAATGEHEEMSFSDAAHRLGTSVRKVALLLEHDEVASYTHHHMVQTKYLLKRIGK